MARTSQKQVQQQIASVAHQLDIPVDYLHLSPQYGYYTLQMYTLDNDGNKTSSVRTIASGMSLGQLSQSLVLFLEITYQAARLRQEAINAGKEL